MDFIKTQLSRHEYPRQVEFVASLPKTPAGKLNRKALRDQQRRIDEERATEAQQRTGQQHSGQPQQTEQQQRTR